MAEAGIAAFGAAAGVAITMAIVLFALRGKGHPESIEWDIQMELQECTWMCGCKRLDLENISCTFNTVKFSFIFYILDKI